MLESRLSSWIKASILGVAGGLLAACGGGGGGSTAAPVASAPPTPGQSTTWTQGVFQAASSFKDLCAAPRSGVDIEGNTFPDQAGRLIDELFWLRSWTEETYLWNDEVTDQDPNGFSDRVAYFDVLKTNAVEPSGEPRDDFHFSQPTSEFLAARNSSGNPGYGAEFAIVEGTRPRDIRVAYSEPNSPASSLVNGVVALPRGSKILEINGQDVINGFTTDAEVSTLLDLLFPDANGLTRTFRVQDVDGTIRTFSLTTQDIVRKPVLQTSIINNGGTNVGYIVFNTFSPFASEEEIILAMQSMQSAGVTELVLDLRYNGGGLLAVASQLAYMVAGPSATNGRAFERLVFNDDAGNLNPVDGTLNEPIPFYNDVLGFDSGSSLTVGASLPALNLSRVFVLATENTCSASESVINGLRGVNIDVVLIGATTCGKPYGFFPQDNCGETYYTIQFQGANDQGFGDFADGFVPNNSSATFGVKIPGCEVSDDFTKALGDTDEALLATALAFQTSGTCPVVTTKTTGTFVANKATGMSALSPELEVQQFFLQYNRDMRMPK